MSIRYGQKTFNLTNKKISSAFISHDRVVKPKTPTATLLEYTRPTDYITMPSIANNEQKVALLIFISNDTSNFLSFTVAGNYTVDWGDGVTENFSTGVAAYHTYDYSTFDVSNTTLNSQGFKQAIAIITPQGGANLTSLNFLTKHSSALAANAYTQPIEELYISGPNLTSLTIATDATSNTAYCRRTTYVNLINTGNITSFVNLAQYMTALQKMDIGVTAAVTTMSGMFAHCYGLIEANFSSSGNYASCTTLANMFIYCYSLQRVTLRGTTAATNLTNMFYQCYSLIYAPMLDMKTSSSVDISNMFDTCHSLVEAPLYDTRAVTTTAYMFNGCLSLPRVPLFNMVSVTTANSMFSSCANLRTVPAFNFTNVTNASYMFNGCWSLQYIFLSNIAKITNMANMFQNCYALASAILLDVRAVTNMSSMFYNCYSLQSVNLTNTQAVTDASNMFYSCRTLQNAPFFNTASVTNMNSMFYSCYSLESVPLLDTANVTNMGSMFLYCYRLTSVPLFNTIKVTTMASMFNFCYRLTSVPLFNTVAVTTMTSMFNQCRCLTTIPLFNTSIVTNMYSMFSECRNLQYLPALNTSSVTDMSYFVNNASKLISLPSLNLNASTTYTGIFSTCYSIASILFTNVRYTIDLSNLKLSKEALETFFANLGTAATGATRTLTLTNNWGAPTPVSLTGTTTAGSTTITMASTTGLVTGMQVTGTNTPLTTGRAVTFTDAGDLVNLTAHGLSNGDEVSFSSIASTTGIVINTIYFVVNAAADNFQVASTAGGAALTLTTNGSGTVKYNSTIASIVVNTSVTMTRPMAGSAAQTLAFRALGTYKAILKGFAITG